MAQSYEFAANKRNRVGTGAARALRRDGRVPAIILGGGQPVEAIDISHREASVSLKKGGFLTRLGSINIAGKRQPVIAKNYQLDPVTDTLKHIDFLRISSDTKLTVEIPINLVNQDISPGLKRGGVVNIVRHTIEMEVPADRIPQSIEIDLKTANLGDSVHISSIDLPEDCLPTIRDRDFTIITIAAPAGLKEETEEEAAGEGEEAEAQSEED